MFGIGSILVPWVQSPVLSQYQSDFDSSTEISQKNSSVLTAPVLEHRHPMFLIFLLLPSSLQFLEGS